MKNARRVSIVSTAAASVTAALFMSAGSASAATYFWDGTSTGSTTADGGDGNWNTTAGNTAWWNGTTNVVWTTNEATFGGAAGTVTVGTVSVANRIDFTTAGYTLNSGAITFVGPQFGGTILAVASTLAGSGDITLNSGSLLRDGQTYSMFNNSTTSKLILGGSVGQQAGATGSTSLVLDGPGNFDVTGTVSTMGSGSFVKRGLGTATVTGTGRIGTLGVTVYRGSLVLDNSGTAIDESSGNGRLTNTTTTPTAASLTLAGGTFVFQNSNANTVKESFGTLFGQNGASKLDMRNAYNGELNFNNISVGQANFGVIDILSGAGSLALGTSSTGPRLTTTSFNGTNSILNGVTVNGTNLALNDTFGVRALVATDYQNGTTTNHRTWHTAAGTQNTFTSASNVLIPVEPYSGGTNSKFALTTTATTINSLRIETDSTQQANLTRTLTVDAASATTGLTLAQYANILMNGDGKFEIKRKAGNTTGAIAFSNGGNAVVNVSDAAGELTLNIPVAFTGSSQGQFYKTGAGTAVAMFQNPVFSGYVLGGTLKLGRTLRNSADTADTSILFHAATDPLTIDSGGTFEANGADATMGTLTVREGALRNSAGSSNQVTTVGAVNLGGQAGTTSVIDTGVGTLKIGGNVTYTESGSPDGATISGKLDLNNATRTFTVNDSTAAAVDLLVNSVVSNSGATPAGLTKANGGVMKLATANTFDGDTKVTGGQLLLGHNLALQNSAFDTTGANGTTIALALDTGVTTPTFGGLKGSNAVATAINSSYNNVTALTLKPESTQTASYSGVITDGAAGMALIKSGAGTQTLTGDSRYTGATTVRSGTLVLGNEVASTDLTGAAIASVNTSQDTVTLAGGQTVVAGQHLVFGGTASPGGLTAGNVYYALSDGSTFSVSTTPGGTKKDINSGGTNPTVTRTGALGSTNSAIVLGDSSTSATDTIGLLMGSANVNERAITVANYGAGTTIGGNTDVTSTYSGTIALNKGVSLTSAAITPGNTVNFTGDITGGFGVTKVGDGTVTFTGAKSYTGQTQVAKGTLALAGGATLASNSLVLGDSTGGTTGTLDASALSSFSASNVSGKGTLNLGAGKTLSVNGLAPGFSIGQINVTGDLSLAGTTTMELGGTGNVAGVDVDNTNVSGALAYGGTLNIAGYNGFDLATEGTYNLFDFGSQSSNFTSVSVGSTALVYNSGSGSWTGSGAADYSFELGTGELTVSAAVPEPTCLALLGLGGMGLLARRRRMA